MPDQPNPPAAERHWADQFAAQAAAAGTAHHVSTGISPSGEIHVGNLREVMTGEILARALRDAGATAELHYFADDFDPLRRVYPFLDQATYEPHLGKPISAIPCPCGDHPSYAEHFLASFLAALPRLGIELTVYRSHQIYASGRMTPMIVRALEGRDRIAAILKDLTGKETKPEWSPFQVVCPACGRMTAARVTGFSAADETVDYSCRCGSDGSVPMAGGGKLQWRIDWPARWKILGVTVEPFGKDHASDGGSYDSGARIIRELFDGEPPMPVPYEWIKLRGRGDMASSKGNVVAVSDLLGAVPPEVMRYLIARPRPMKTISFDPGRPLLTLVDEYEALENDRSAPRLLELCRVEGFRPVGVPFRHLASVIQMANGDADRAVEILRRGPYEITDPGAVKERLAQARAWLDRFAPEGEKFALQDQMPEAVAGFTAPQKKFLALLAERLEPEMDAERIHVLIYELCGEVGLAGPREAFQAIYLSLLGKKAGPRAGWFLSILDAEFLKERFGRASE